MTHNPHKRNKLNEEGIKTTHHNSDFIQPNKININYFIAKNSKRDHFFPINGDLNEHV